MQPGRSEKKQSGLYQSLAGLLIASISIIAILTVALDKANPATGNVGVKAIMVICVLVGLFIFAIVAGYTLFSRAISDGGRFKQKASAEIASLRDELQLSQAVIEAEPHVLIVWEPGKRARVLTSNMPGMHGLPTAEIELLNFRGWLSVESFRDFEGNLQRVLNAGQPFNQVVLTRNGARLEADGRHHAGRTILKIRDIAAHRTALNEVMQRHRIYERDIAAHRALLDALPMPVWFRGPDGQIAWVNDSYMRSIDANSIEQVRQENLELLETRQRNAVASTLARGTAFRQRQHLIVSGDRRPFDVVVVPFGGSSAGIAIDVAALETAEGKLTRQSAAHDRTLDRVASGVATFGTDQRLVYFNKAYIRLWGIDTAWLDSHPTDSELLDHLRETRQVPIEVDYRAWKSKLMLSYTNKEAYEDWWHLPDGRTIHVIGEPLPDGGITYLYDDVTERFALESRYNALIQVQRETLDHLSEGVALFATDGRLKLYNPTFSKIWGLSPQSLMGQPHIDQIIQYSKGLFADDKTWNAIKRAITSISDHRKPIHGQMNLQNGTHIQYAATPLPEGSTLFTYVDTTDARRVERVLRERNEALEAADRLKNTFISHISYQLRTPLNTIIGFAEMLMDPGTGQMNAKQVEYNSYIRSAGGTLATIIDDILELATLDAGQLELTMGPAAPANMITNSINAMRDRIEQAGVAVQMYVDPAAPTIIADEARITQVLTNLLSNAVGFSKPGDPVTVSCRANGSMLTFEVKDDGMGVPLEQQASVFDRFETSSHGSDHRGVGLGLSVAKSLVELHGGTMGLASYPGQGTTVSFEIPLNGIQRQQLDEQIAIDSVVESAA